jgi:rSAM/selenodomain-associated transferase 1
MKQRNALVIFVKNLVYGKVKTRLAATIGAEGAYKVYAALIAHTSAVTQNIPADKIVYYAEKVEDEDAWDHRFNKALQHGRDLGERMMNALLDGFKKGYKNVIIIGSDCPALNKHIINDAFDRLESYDVVIGPAFDGGYYLIGMKTMHPYLFEEMEWSTPSVFEVTAARCKSLHLAYAVLPPLHDIDDEKDLVHLKTAGV